MTEKEKLMCADALEWAVKFFEAYGNGDEETAVTHRALAAKLRHEVEPNSEFSRGASAPSAGTPGCADGETK